MNVEVIPDFILEIVNGWPWLHRKVNAIAINGLVNVAPHRPHPWSTVHDYTSWTSLTDLRWSARHLPAKYTTGLPVPADLIGLFQRPTGQQEFCKKSTCLFPAFAQYLTDGFIRTRMPDTSKGETDEMRLQNTSNHQIDLCPLYGITQEQTAQLRLKSSAPGEKGRLKSQLINGEEFAPFYYNELGNPRAEFDKLDKPLGIDNFPDPQLRAHIFAFGGDRANAVPHVAMINTLLLREHNRLAGEIERRYPQWDDERVFQTARNTVIVLFIIIVVEEYINHITPVPLRFRADPTVAWDAPWNKPNWITTEFSLLYRWHSLMPDTITWNSKEYAIGDTFMDNRPLLDAGLARAFADMSSQRAGRLGSFNTAQSLLGVEAKAIDQGRLCHLASYSDYRQYVKLSRPTSFEDISQNQDVVNFLRGRYTTVDDVDFYIGLFAEDTVKNSPLPELILRLVAVDAFSQALTNPLLSRTVFHQDTFSEPGWEAIQNTHTLKEILHRNSPNGIGDARISMTRDGWKRS